MTEDDGPADVYAADGYFAVIPEWVLDSGVSSRAIHVYALLRRYADQRTAMATPSRRTLAGRLGLADEKSVDGPLKELVGVGAIRITARYSNGTRARVQAGPTPEFSQRAANGYLLLAQPHPRSHYAEPDAQMREPGAGDDAQMREQAPRPAEERVSTPFIHGGGGGESAPPPRPRLIPDQPVLDGVGEIPPPTALAGDGGRVGENLPPRGGRNRRGTKELLTTERTSSPTARITPVDCREQFAIFWQRYPRRVGKIAAEKAFTKAAKVAGPEAVLAGLERATFPADPQFVPHPATWLNQGRWEDEAPAAAAPAKETRPWETTVPAPSTAASATVRGLRPWEI